METLRLGICSCAKMYHGIFHDSRISIPDGFGFRQFRIQEVIVSQNIERKALKANRCHFFLDSHSHREGWDTKVYRNSIISNGEGRGERLFIGGTQHGNKMNVTKREPARDEEVRTALATLVAKIKPREFELWLKEMG